MRYQYFVAIEIFWEIELDNTNISADECLCCLLSCTCLLLMSLRLNVAHPPIAVADVVSLVGGRLRKPVCQLPLQDTQGGGRIVD